MLVQGACSWVQQLHNEAFNSTVLCSMVQSANMIQFSLSPHSICRGIKVRETNYQLDDGSVLNNNAGVLILIYGEIHFS
jgi:hypothetical protein